MSKRLRQEDGIALVMALGMMIVLVIMVASMISFTSASSRNSRVSNSRVDAQSIAEGGISAAVSIINKAANVSSPTILGCTADASGSNSVLPCTDVAINVPGGTAYIHGIYTQGQSATGAWTITSYGSVRNPTGSSNLTKTMTATLSITGGGQSNNISVWNYMYSTSPPGSGCEVDITGNNVIVNVPVYITGDLCISGNNAGIIENTANGGQKIDVRVGGKVVIGGNNASVGTSAHPITSGYSALGCASTINGTPHPCTTADSWYVGTTDTPLTATPPTADYPGSYSSASPGPSHVCDTTLTPSPNLTGATNVFDNDGTMNGTNPTFNLTPNSDYNCVTAATTSCPSGQMLKWNHTTHLMTICGTMFFDGNVTFTDGSGMYHGTGTIYVNGVFQLTGNNSSLRAGCPSSPASPTHQCAFNSTGNEWNPNKDMLLVVTNKPGATSVDMTGNNVQFQGDLMCPSTSTANMSGNNVIVEGGIICGKFAWGNNPIIYPLPTITNLPPGAPVPPNAPATVGTPVITAG